MSNLFFTQDPDRIANDKAKLLKFIKKDPKKIANIEYMVFKFKFSITNWVMLDALFDENVTISPNQTLGEALGVKNIDDFVSKLAPLNITLKPEAAYHNLLWWLFSLEWFNKFAAAWNTGKTLGFAVTKIFQPEPTRIKIDFCEDKHNLQEFSISVNWDSKDTNGTIDNFKNLPLVWEIKVPFYDTIFLPAHKMLKMDVKNITVNTISEWLSNQLNKI